MPKPNQAKLTMDGAPELPRALRCPTCSRANPADAYYCHHDGKALFKDLQQVPLQMGNLNFPTPFCFANGNACGTFNQLALGCNNLWEEARELLKDGIWVTFLAGMGRLDLAAVARQAAKETDLDLGLSQLIERFPADPDFLRPPQAAVAIEEVRLGQMVPGTDYVFDLVLLNRGMLLLHGTVSSNFDWLVFGEQVDDVPAEKPTLNFRALAKVADLGDHRPTAKRFQTRQGCTIPVLVRGSKPRAGVKPLRGDILIDSNGGALTVPVLAEIPIRPFPKGSVANDCLAGVRSPRELAIKAKANPREAGALFEQGAVKAWYASNGWTYPIEGSDGMGVGAVQQFFEALGLTKPPRLEIDTAFLMYKGRIGESHVTRVTLRTREGKPVYAHAWSNQPWVKPGPIKYLGNKVQIPVEIMVPADVAETAQAQLLIQGNGSQRFVVPVTVTVRRG